MVWNAFWILWTSLVNKQNGLDDFNFLIFLFSFFSNSEGQNFPYLLILKMAFSTDFDDKKFSIDLSQVSFNMDIQNAKDNDELSQKLDNAFFEQPHENFNNGNPDGR